MTPYFEADGVTLHLGECVDVMAAMPAASVDAICTDPPYELNFMGRAWDASGAAYDPATWREALRVLKPGGHLAAFGGTRTYHRMACAIEDAGFEIRDSLAWIYGQGFPKSLDVGKAIDAAAGAERAVIRPRTYALANDGGYSGGLNTDRPRSQSAEITAPATDAARRWDGWGTALKPGIEPVVFAMKPYATADIMEAIGSHLDRLEGECRQLANGAEPSSAPTPADLPGAKIDSAHERAVTQPVDDPARRTATGAGAGSPGPTGTSWSESAAITCSNTVTSWRRCWDAICELTNTSTTSTTSGPTTDLTTLRSCISSLTATNMLRSDDRTAGLSSHAAAVDSLFAAAYGRLSATLALSVIESATDETRTAPRVGTAPGNSHPGIEPIVLARKPLDGTVAANVQRYGTGALNIDACRVTGVVPRTTQGRSVNIYGGGKGFAPDGLRESQPHDAGRWPTNVIFTHDGDCDAACAPGCPVAELDQQSGTRPTHSGGRSSATARRDTLSGPLGIAERGGYDETGGASRFFPTFRYEAKAPAAERPRLPDGTAWPTVKPVALMRWLVRLITPPGGLVLDPFAGSGTTGEAARAEGFRCVLIEQDETAAQLTVRRLMSPPGERNRVAPAAEVEKAAPPADEQLDLFGGAA